MPKILLIILFSSCCLAGFSQKAHTSRKEEKRRKISSIVKQEEEGIITYHNQLVAGAKLVTDGYGVFFEYGKYLSPKKSILFQLDIAEKKSQKEQKESTYNGYGTTPFIYGKVNFVYPVKLGMQFQSLLGNKSNKNGVSVTANYGGGLSLAFLRPYMIQVNKSGTNTYVSYNSADSLLFLDPTLIQAGPGFGTGWNKTTVTPGIYGKTALRFDYGTYNEMVSAIEIGLIAEFYTKNVPIMVYSPAKKFFFSAYASIMIGRRK